MAKCLRAIELAPKAEQPRSEVNAHWMAAFFMQFKGDRDATRSHAAACLVLAETLRDQGLLASALMINDIACRMEGDWETARTFNERGLEVAPRDVGILTAQIMIAYELGEAELGDSLLERLLEIIRTSAPGPTLEYALQSIVIPSVARITGKTDRLEVAEAAARAVFSSPSAVPLVTGYCRTGMALIAVLRDDAADAREQYAALESMGLRFNPGINGTLHGVFGLLAQTMGDLELAASHFEQAMAFCGKAGFLPELAWACCDYADTLLQRNGGGDRAKAMSLLDESLAVSTELGMRPLTERVQSQREILGV